MTSSENSSKHQKNDNTINIAKTAFLAILSAAFAIYFGYYTFAYAFADAAWRQNLFLSAIRFYSILILPSVLIGFLMGRFFLIATLGSWFYLYISWTIGIAVLIIQVFLAYLGYRLRLLVQRSTTLSWVCLSLLALPLVVFIAAPTGLADRAWLELRRFTMGEASSDPFEDGLRAYHKRDYVKAYLRWLPLAEAGHAQAQFRLGEVWIMVPGLDRSGQLYWWKKAAEQGIVEAQVEVAKAQKDPAEALAWYRKAASKNYAPAQTRIGRAYQFGLGVIRDHSEALKWYLLAADQGYVEAQLQLGKLYKWGIDGKPDVIRAYAWFEMAAKTSPEARVQRDRLQKTMSQLQLSEAQALAADLGSADQN